MPKEKKEKKAKAKKSGAKAEKAAKPAKEEKAAPTAAPTPATPPPTPPPTATATAPPPPPTAPPPTWEEGLFAAMYPPTHAAPPSMYYSYARDITSSFHSKYGSLAAVDSQLLAKREALLGQMSRVQGRIDAVGGARRAIERETMADAESIVSRLRSAEAVKLSVLHHDMEGLRSQVLSIDRFHASFAQFWPRSVRPPVAVPGMPGGSGGDAGPLADPLREGPARAMEFMKASTDLSNDADRLLSAPLPTHIDVRSDDFERETAMRLEALERFDAMAELLTLKDKMIWKLLSEREAAAGDVEAISAASGKEMEEWRTLSDRLTSELGRFKMVCAYCATRLDPSTVNTGCEVNTPINAAGRTVLDVSGDDGPQASRGSRRHYFVNVTDTAAATASTM